MNERQYKYPFLEHSNFINKLTKQFEVEEFIADFKSFLSYVCSRKIRLTPKRRWIPMKHIYAINTLMRNPLELDQPVGGKVYKTRDEDAAPRLYFMDLLAEAAECIRADKKDVLFRGPEYKNFLKMNGFSKKRWLIASWWFNLDWDTWMPMWDFGKALQAKKEYIVPSLEWINSIRHAVTFKEFVKILSNNLDLYSDFLSRKFSKNEMEWGIERCILRPLNWLGIISISYGGSGVYGVKGFYVKPLGTLFIKELIKCANDIKQRMDRAGSVEAVKSIRNVYEFKITLKGSKPPVWRRIQVPETYTFWDLYVAIQDAMGWTDSHPHEFKLKNPLTGEESRIGIPDAKNIFPSDIKVLKGWEEKIADWFSPHDDTAEYIYDFGDNWIHRVKLEKILPRNKNIAYPKCINGKRACPPENCGGIWGYEEICRGENESQEHFKGYDPNRFNPEKIRFDDPKERLRNVFSEESEQAKEVMKKNTSGNLKFGIGYYKKDEWNRFVASADDRNDLEDTHDNWLDSFNEAVMNAKKAGLKPEKVVISVDELIDYCIDKKMKNNSETRSGFVAELLRQGRGEET